MLWFHIYVNGKTHLASNVCEFKGWLGKYIFNSLVERLREGWQEKCNILPRFRPSR